MDEIDILETLDVSRSSQQLVGVFATSISYLDRFDPHWKI